MNNKKIWLSKNMVFLSYLPIFSSTSLCTNMQTKKDISHIGFPTPVKK